MFVETGKIGSGRAAMALQGQLFREMAFVSTNYDEETKAWRDCLNGKEYAKTKILQFTPQYGIKELDLNDVVAKAKHNFDKKIAMVKRFAQGDTVRNNTEKYAREFAAIEKDPRAFYEGLLNALETAEKNLKDARYARSLEVRGVTEEEANEERERGGGGRKGVRRQTTAARKRAKLMAMHAGNKETLDEVEAEEKQNATDKGFGDGEDDWSMYSQMARGADKAIDGEIKDPGAQKVSACESLWEKARAEVLAVDPQYEIRKLSGMEARQLKVRAERIRAPESLFHPEILASKGIVRQVKDTRGGLAAIVDEFIIPQGGVQDALKESFKRCGKDVEHEILREKGKDASIVLTGGLSRLPGLQTRLQDYVISNSYPGMAPTVTLSKNGSKDGIFDAWKGLSSLSSSSSSAGIVVTRDEWLEHGESVFHSER
jgi:actin-related protein